MRNTGFAKSLTTVVKLLATVLVIVLYMHYFYRQSWGFYTSKSNLPMYSIYSVKNGVAEKESLLKNNLSYGMGISGKGKILFSELYNIIEKSNLPWKLLSEDSVNAIVQHSNYVLISKSNDYPDFNDSFLITRTYRPSYDMLKSNQQFHLSKQYILADIR